MPLISPSRGDAALIHSDSFHLFWTVGEHPSSYTSVLWQKHFLETQHTHQLVSISSKQLSGFLLLPGSTSLFCNLVCLQETLSFYCYSEPWNGVGMTTDVNRLLCPIDSHVLTVASPVVMWWGWQQQWSTGVNTHLSWRNMVVLLLGSMTYPGTGFYPGLQYQTWWTPPCRTGLRFQ